MHAEGFFLLEGFGNRGVVQDVSGVPEFDVRERCGRELSSVPKTYLEPLSQPQLEVLRAGVFPGVEKPTDVEFQNTYPNLSMSAA